MCKSYAIQACSLQKRSPLTWHPGCEIHLIPQDESTSERAGNAAESQAGSSYPIQSCSQTSRALLGDVACVAELFDSCTTNNCIMPTHFVAIFHVLCIAPMYH